MMKRVRWLDYFQARYSARWFSFFIMFGYGFVSFFAYYDTSEPSFLHVAWLAVLSSLTVIFFSEVSISGNKVRFPKIVLGVRFLFWGVFVFFGAFALLVMATAEAIPLLAWFTGADAGTLVVLREKFLKSREGWQAIFPYINSLFAGALIPYCLACFFIKETKWRWFAFVFFLIYCVLFIEKVFFLKAMIPLIYVLYCIRKGRTSSLTLVVAGCFFLVFALGVVSGFGEGLEHTDTSFFSRQYRPAGTFNYLVWRTISVPVFTAADSLAFFVEELNSVPLLGATSGLLAKILGLDRVYFERDVFGYQWGQTITGTGSANAVYFIDAYVNYGLLGVFLFSALIGVLFKAIAKSNDEALHAVWPLFAIGLYVAGLVGNLASSGFALVFIVSFIFKFRSKNNTVLNNHL